MINLYKANGEIKPRKGLLAHFTEATVALARSEFYSALSAEYEAMYPSTRDMTTAEKVVNDTNEFDEVIVRDAEYVYPQVTIEYITTDEESGDEIRTPAEYVTQSEWLAEDVVTVVGVEAEYDEEGMTLVEAVQEVREMVRPFVAPIVTSEDLDAYLAPRFSELRKYPAVEDQLDAIYWDGVNNTTLWADSIRAEKARVPKPL